MARSPGLVGGSLLGTPRATARPPNTSSLTRYILVLAVVVIGAIYAAPNLFQPDSALQIRPIQDIASDGPASQINERVLESAVAALRDNGIEVIGSSLGDNSGLIRLTSDEAQLRGQQILRDHLNPDFSERYLIALTRASTTPAWLEDMGGKPMSLGLDLSGGVHFLLQVDMEKFLADRMESNQEALQDLFVQNRIRYVGRDWIDGSRLRVGFQSDEARDAAEDAIREQFVDFDISSRDVDGNPGLVLTVLDSTIREIEDLAISQNLQSLRNRVNELGVSEPLVQRLGRSRIVLDLPGVQDPAAVKGILNKFANLEFRMVAPPSARASQTERFEYEGAPVVLEKRIIVSGNNVANAIQEYDPESSLPQVSITLDNDGGIAMNNVTKDRVGDPMAVIFKETKFRIRTIEQDGETVTVREPYEIEKVINVATVQSALGFRFRITGLDLQEARDLALLLRAGALAAPMYIVEERTVGASLGEDNINAGQQSVSIGFVLVMIFMLFYYRWFGLAANIALTANLVLLVAVMSVLGATLTLPGIAGIVLTVGMAVDANVLIFSRIREELKQRSPQQAIQAGFDRAVLTILDANITTFFVAIILLSLGSGPVKGFAVTLAVGIVTSMFTAVLGTRTLINLMYGGRKLEKLAI